VTIAGDSTESGGCYDGFVPLSGWWSGFCGDEARNFPSDGDYGVMHTNAEALKFLDHGRRFATGFIELEVYFATDRVPQSTGGLHILSLCSQHRALGSPRVGNGYTGWLRPDFQIRAVDGTTAELQIGTYNLTAAGESWFQREPGKRDVVVDVWRTGIPLRPKEWIKLRFEWRRSGETITYTLNGKVRSVRIHRDSLDIDALAVGNMDGLVKSGRSVYGGTPEIRYRNVRWGPI
jgi:hypothetical protein